jgi:hypothetical protein
MRRPQNRRIPLLIDALWRLIKLRSRRRNHGPRRVRSCRLLQIHIRRLPRNHHRHLCPRPRLLQRNPINHRRHIFRQVRRTHPIDAVARPPIMDHCFPLQESRCRRLNLRPRRGVRSEPPRPLFSRILGVPAAHKKFQPRLLAFLAAFCRAAHRWRAPPLNVSPLRKKFRVKRSRLKRPFRFILRPQRKNFPRIRRAQIHLPAARPRNPGNLRRSRFRQLRIHAAPVNHQQRSAVTRPCKQPPI